MKLVVDTNVLFSFFKKESKTRRLILNFEILEPVTPSFCIDELSEHKELICEKSKLSDRDKTIGIRHFSFFRFHTQHFFIHFHILLGRIGRENKILPNKIFFFIHHSSIPFLAGSQLSLSLSLLSPSSRL